MTEDAAFQSAIQANPLDDLPRLVYADWLDEQSRTDEAEYLRLVAALAATGSAVDLAHPHAVRLLALAQRLDDPWREQVGSRFDLWFDEIRPDRMINFIKCVREISGSWLSEAKAFCESLPRAMNSPVPLEEAVAQADVTAEAVTRYRIIPSTEARPHRLLRRDVSLIWSASFDDRTERERSVVNDITIALERVKRILEHDSEFAHLASTIPQTLNPESTGYVEYSVVLANGLRGGEGARQVRLLSRRLFGHETWVRGTTADPPFAGDIRVHIERKAMTNHAMNEPFST